MPQRRSPKPATRRLPRGAKLAEEVTFIGPEQPIGEQPAAQPKLPPPVPEVVALARDFLAGAESGFIRAVALAAVLSDARTDAKSAVPAGDVIVTHVLNSSVASLGYQVLRALHEPAAVPASPSAN